MSEGPREAGDDAIAPAERVFYRDVEEFNKTMDAASKSIRKEAGPDVVGNLVWWGLVALLVFLYLDHWFFEWGLRHGLVTGLDLVKPLWVGVVAILVFHHAWTRNRHGRILKGRLCLRCGSSLRETPVDENGDGGCPTCARSFNLGEYRRPRENHGRDFRGYIDAEHFDKAILAAGAQIRKTRGLGLESDLLNLAWVALALSVGCRFLLGWDLLGWLSGFLGYSYNGILFLVLLAWSWWHHARVKRLVPAIVEQRLCMNCGFCLQHTPTDAAGIGRCPQCGRTYSSGEYERPSRAAEKQEAGAPALR